MVAQQGYPRIDVVVKLDEVLKAMPEDLQEDPEAFRAWVEDAIRGVEATVAALQPDDTYVHSSAIKVNRPVGTVDSSSLGAVGGLITNLERQIIRALKTMPLLMGVNEATSETHANRQWEVYTQGIKALQHLAESLLEYLLGKALQAQGVAAGVRFRFAEMRASEGLRDQQTLQLKLLNYWNAYVYGLISLEDVAKLALNRACDQDEPRYLPKNLVSGDAASGTGGDGAAPGAVDPGALRRTEDGGLRTEGEGLAADLFGLSPERVAAYLAAQKNGRGH